VVGLGCAAGHCWSRRDGRVRPALDPAFAASVESGLATGGRPHWSATTHRDDRKAAQAEHTITLLSTICHEICHTTMVGLDAGGTARDVGAAGARLIWSEHIVERRRQAAFKRLGWSATPYPVLHLTALVVSWYRHHAPSLLLRAEPPQREVATQWLTILNEYVSVLGRARAGAIDEAEAFASFVGPMPADRRLLWEAVEAAADEAFASPTCTAAELDVITERAWRPLRTALFAEWDAAYAANAPARLLRVAAAAG
jgi:hypothetical protein